MINNNKNLIFWGIAATAGVGLVLFSYFSGPPRHNEPVTISDVVQSSTPDSVNLPQPTLRPTPTPFLGLNGIKAPATCQVNGEAEFSDPGLYSSNTKLSWQNVDSQGRLINWHISPQDSLAIGPNIFANLEVPDGEYENLTIRLPESPVSKNYLLTASITYGQIIQGDVKVKETNCSGEVKVNLNF